MRLGRWLSLEGKGEERIEEEGWSKVNLIYFYLTKYTYVF
jgi:hypothetical protein